MQNLLAEERPVKIASVNGMDVYHIKMDKFKTNAINIFFHDNLHRESVSKNAILPAVLRRGCGKFPTFQEIALHLEELYGTSFDCGVAKKGERQIIQFYTEFVADKYTADGAGLFEKAAELLFEVITNPVLENGVFKKDYIEQEKENLKKMIEGRVNDKAQYAVERCFEEVCRDEPYGIYEYGSVADLESIDAGNLFEHYRRVLETLPVSVYITGNVEEDNIKKVLDRLSAIRRGNIKTVDISSVHNRVSEVREVVEKMSVNQGKLSMGFRTGISANSKDYYSLVVYNGILGGGVHSKLFQNVREKASLAYYVFSRMERFKGLMVVSSGIEIENKDRAKDIILRQMEEIREGNISDYEYESTIKTIETGMKSLKDSQLNIVDFYLSQAIVGTDDDFESFTQKIKDITKQDVVNVAGNIKLDTVYFLTQT